MGAVLCGLVACAPVTPAGALRDTRAPVRLVVTASAASSTYRNPVFARDFPDPNVLKVGPDYYVYGATTGWEPAGHLFPILILRSCDLAHWRYVGNAFARAPGWGSGDWWAPVVVAHKNASDMYYVGKNASGTPCVAVALAARPQGPYVHQRVVGCGDAKGIGYIDPAPLLDADGKAYLYVSVDNPFDSPYPDISALPLAPDLLRQDGPRRALFSVSQDWEHGAGYTTVDGVLAG